MLEGCLNLVPKADIGNTIYQYLVYIGGMMQSPDSILVINKKSDGKDAYLLTLKQMGYKVHSTENIQQALDHIQLRNYALVMIKLDMPGDAELRQITWVRSIRRHLPILLMVKRAPRRLLNEFSKAGVNACLFQPVKDKHLLSTVEKLVPFTAQNFV
jgi:DNA-binding NtrC family response regulator